MLYRNVTSKIITAEEELRVYKFLKNSKKSFTNKPNIRNIMRKLEIRDQKRSQGFSVHLLEKSELQKAGINLSDSSFPQQSRKSYKRRENKKSLKENKEVVSARDASSPSSQLTVAEESSFRVLDRYQVK